ncbi:MAG: phenylalanine--tRNA ligase subunit beta, partial [Oscillospiraceae bacterium]|nr:phenylalanine--tRNA ligase subunit beta [Oscillospiraceae bacterium]
MNLSMKWLSDFVSVDCTPRAYSEAMTMSGSKVEGYEIEGSEISNVVVGKVLSVEKHPDADKLVVCQVDIGRDEPIQIVTGATNVTPSALVPCALDNSTLPGGVKIKKGKLRGVESNGMMCSIAELGVTLNDFPYAIADGILIIEEDCKPGDDIREALGLNDTSVEFEITSNRPDCLSVIGLARETAATFGTALNLHELVVKGCGGDINDLLSVTVENTDLCMRYVAKVVKNVKIAPSPRWMRERLRASGVRPINNLVDITNYVMLEYGQPMHAFDLRYVEGNQIVVRNAKAGESIVTLEGVEHPLSEEMLAICDSKKPAAVAGIMGGEYSGIMEDTNTVVFESACFNGASVRTTAKKLGLRTESSARFEKGLDPANCMPAILRACELVELLGAGEVVDGVIDVDHSPAAKAPLDLECDWINRFLGIELSKEEMIRILNSLEFEVKNDKVIVPSFRVDIEEKADIAEEIARIYGYDKIPSSVMTGVAKAALTPKQKFERKLHDVMLAAGCYEVMTYSFVSPKCYDKINLAADSPLRNSVVISNPLGEDTSVMRTTAIPSMMEVLARNYNNRNATAWLYEIGNEYIPNGENELPNENPELIIGLYGNQASFYTLKGIVEAVLSAINLPDWDIAPKTDDPTFHPGR